LFQKVDVAYSQSSSLNPAIQGICMMNKGFYSMSLGKWDEAHRYWNESLNFNPHNMVVRKG
jgi:hypothetical protein